jgi:hypothetical protein
MDICAGGTVSIGATLITFTNDHTVECTITRCDMPGWPKTDPVIPKRQGGTPGSGIVHLTQPAIKGKYTYTPDCCGKQTDPQIKVE